MRKIALSAAYYGNPEVAKLLEECEVIFTTQTNNTERLYMRFGKDKVYFIPDRDPETIEHITQEFKNKFPDVVFYTYEDLHKIFYKE
jgi:hypothetical protein